MENNNKQSFEQNIRPVPPKPPVPIPPMPPKAPIPPMPPKPPIPPKSKPPFSSEKQATNIPPAPPKPPIKPSALQKKQLGKEELTPVPPKPPLPPRPPEFKEQSKERPTKTIETFVEDKPKKFFLANWKFWIISLTSIVLVGFITLAIFYFTSINAKIDAPTGLKVYALSNGDVYVQVDENERAVEYEFLISYNQGESQRFNSNTNVFKAEFINLAGEYVISCKIIGMSEQANSDYCENVTFLKKVKILTPTISLNTTENKLNFSLQDHFVENVELKFYLYYGADENGPFVNDESVIVSNDNRGAVHGYFELDFLPAGEHLLSVKVEAVDNEIYLPSDLSLQVEYNAVD